MYEYQYIVGGTLSLLVSIYVLIKRPRTLALKSLIAFGLVVSLWEFSDFLAQSAPDAITAARFFSLVILTSHLGFPLYLFTILAIREKINRKIPLLITIPVVIQIFLFSRDYFNSYEFILADFGWYYRVVSLQLPIVIAGAIFASYLIAIVIVLFSLTRNVTVPLLKRKYTILLVSFTCFQAVGTTLTNALLAFDLINPSFGVGGVLQFLTFLSIWYALSLKVEKTPLSTVRGKDFSQIYSSFLTIYYNRVVGSQLGEEVFVFKNFIRESKIEDQVLQDRGKIIFKEKEDLDLAELIENNLKVFSKGHVDDELTDHYLRVLNVADQRLGWKFDEIVKANMDFLMKSDLAYGISEGIYLDTIAEDKSLIGVEDIDACLKIYKRILLPIMREIQTQKADLYEILSKHNITQGLKISEYGEISIKGVKERLLRVPKDQQVSLIIGGFNSVLSLFYKDLFTNPTIDVEKTLGKLIVVLTLNKDKAVALGVYPTLLGTLATKIPRTQIHMLYSDYLQELVDEKTRELKETQENLLKSQRLAAIGEAAAMVGHDLRNPLQAIVNTLYLADKKLESSSNQDLKEILKTISEQVEYMNKIVSDLQDYARPLNPKFIETSIPELINDTLSMISIPSNVKVKTEIENDLNFPKLIIDASYMKRVFSNLITNAIQAMPDGGRLTMRVSIKGENAVIQFHDTGVGISEENKPKLFQPLFTTKAKGQGLGLPVCKRLVEAQKGTIAVESQLGEGTIFTIELPLAPKHNLNVTKLPSPIAMEHNLRSPSRS